MNCEWQLWLLRGAVLCRAVSYCVVMKMKFRFPKLTVRFNKDAQIQLMGFSVIVLRLS